MYILFDIFWFFFFFLLLLLLLFVKFLFLPEFVFFFSAVVVQTKFIYANESLLTFPQDQNQQQ